MTSIAPPQAQDMNFAWDHVGSLCMTMPGFETKYHMRFVKTMPDSDLRVTWGLNHFLGVLEIESYMRWLRIYAR